MAAKTTLNNTEGFFRRLMDDEDVSTAELDSALLLSVEDISQHAEDIDEEADYTVEKLLEVVAEQLQSFNQGQRQHIERRAWDYWLQLDRIRGGTAREANVRAAELLAELIKANGVETLTIREWVESNDWRNRLVTAWTLRDSTVPEHLQLIDVLRGDRFEDEDGFRLVRNGTAFIEEL